MNRGPEGGIPYVHHNPRGAGDPSSAEGAFTPTVGETPRTSLSSLRQSSPTPSGTTDGLSVTPSDPRLFRSVGRGSETPRGPSVYASTLNRTRSGTPGVGRAVGEGRGILIKGHTRGSWRTTEESRETSHSGWDPVTDSQVPDSHRRIPTKYNFLTHYHQVSVF